MSFFTTPSLTTWCVVVLCLVCECSSFTTSAGWPCFSSSSWRWGCKIFSVSLCIILNVVVNWIMKWPFQCFLLTLHSPELHHHLFLVVTKRLISSDLSFDLNCATNMVVLAKYVSTTWNLLSAFFSPLFLWRQWSPHYSIACMIEGIFSPLFLRRRWLCSIIPGFSTKAFTIGLQ